MSGRDIEVAPGLTKDAFELRLSRGWSIDRALKQPSRRWPDALTRFLANCKPLDNGCIEWQGSVTQKSPKGYGVFYADGKQQLVHRWNYERTHGVCLLPHIDACHSCDFRLCVNEEHVFPGTRLENMRDAALKGRMDRLHKAKGEKHGMSVLTASQVIAIRKDYEEGTSQSDLAWEYEVSVQQIHRIVHHQSWKHIS